MRDEARVKSVLLIACSTFQAFVMLQINFNDLIQRQQQAKIANVKAAEAFLISALALYLHKKACPLRLTAHARFKFN